MAEVLSEFPKGYRARRGQSRWDKYLDGQVWRLTPDDYKGCVLNTVQANMGYQAKKRGMSLRTCTEAGGGLIVQVVSGK